MIGGRPCAYALASVDRVFTGQRYDTSISTSTRRTNISVFCAHAYYAYVAAVFTCLHMCLCLCLCASENQA